MGREELALALKKRGEAEARAIWQRAETAAEEYRREQQQEVDRHCQRCGQESEQAAAVACRRLSWRLTRRSRNLRLQALRELDRRLQQLAAAELSQLPEAERQGCLAALAAEIPPAAWPAVRSRPEDVRSVQTLFAEAQVRADETLIGGIVVESEAGAVQIDNSLLTRLQTLWPEIVGQILRELEGGDAQLVATAEE